MPASEFAKISDSVMLLGHIGNPRNHGVMPCIKSIGCLVQLHAKVLNNYRIFYKYLDY